MNQNSQSNQSRVTQEMFDVANITPPSPYQNTASGVKSSNNNQLPATLSTDNNGLTVDNVRLPEKPKTPTEEEK